MKGYHFICDTSKLSPGDTLVCIFGEQAYEKSTGKEFGVGGSIGILDLGGARSTGVSKTKHLEECTIEFQGGQVFSYGVDILKILPIKMLSIKLVGVC